MANASCDLGHVILLSAQVSIWTLSVMTSKNKNGRCSVGTFVKLVWVTMGRKILSNHISAKEEDIEL